MGVSETMLAYTLCVALVMGLCIVLCLETFGPWLLSLIGKNDEILAPATQYLRIRATASPAVMLVMVAQGACFGQQVNATHSTLQAAMSIPDAKTILCQQFMTSSNCNGDCAHLLHVAHSHKLQRTTMHL